MIKLLISIIILFLLISCKTIKESSVNNILTDTIKSINNLNEKKINKEIKIKKKV